MIYSEAVKKAMVVSYGLHSGMFDRGGFPYFAHPLHVAEQMTTEDSTVVALLHDVVEDTDFTREVVDSNTRHGYYIIKK